MQLRIAVVALVLGAPVVAIAQPADEEAGATVRVYTDDDHVTVVTPSARAEAAVGERASVDIAATVDVISAASVDVITQASPGDVEDERYELGVGSRLRLGRASWVRGRVIGSRENDFLGLRASLGARTELARRNTVLELGYTFGHDEIGNAVVEDFERTRNLHQLAVTLTQVLDARTYLDLVVDGKLLTGYQANPYLTVPIVDPASTELMRVPEVVPDRRLGAAGLLRLRRALDADGDWFAHLDYRFYADEWDVTSHTANLRAVAAPWTRLMLAAQARLYVQSAADFHRERYRTPVPELRSATRSFGRSRTLFGSVTADWALGDPTGSPAHLVAMAGLLRFTWLDYAPQSRRDALVFTVGMRTPL